MNALKIIMDSEEKLIGYWENKEEILKKKNPDRDFVLLRGYKDGFTHGVIVWLDGKGELEQ